MTATAPTIGVERKDGCWYARDVFALLAHPAISATLRAELEGWSITTTRTCAIAAHLSSCPMARIPLIGGIA
jgi:hypothetical protein